MHQCQSLNTESSLLCITDSSSTAAIVQEVQNQMEYKTVFSDTVVQHFLLLLFWYGTHATAIDGSDLNVF